MTDENQFTVLIFSVYTKPFHFARKAAGDRLLSWWGVFVNTKYIILVLHILA
jgi:hypothetical protein